MMRAFIALVFTVSVLSASTMTIDTHPFNIDNGGGMFGVSIDGGGVFNVFCDDFNNFSSIGDTYAVNISNGSDLSKTRYGTTPATSFSFGGTLFSALDRYLMAGWLTTQYDLTPGANLGNKDLGIQDAIWSLLDATGAVRNHGDEALWFNNAINWRNGASAATLAVYSADLQVYDSTNVAGASIPGRYSIGEQEYMRMTPEPVSASLVGLGLVGLFLFAKRERHSHGS